MVRKRGSEMNSRFFDYGRMEKILSVFFPLGLCIILSISK